MSRPWLPSPASPSSSGACASDRNCAASAWTRARPERRKTGTRAAAKRHRRPRRVTGRHGSHCHSFGEIQNHQPERMRGSPPLRTGDRGGGGPLPGTHSGSTRFISSGHVRRCNQKAGINGLRSRRRVDAGRDPPGVEEPGQGAGGGRRAELATARGQRLTRSQEHSPERMGDCRPPRRAARSSSTRGRPFAWIRNRLAVTGRFLAGTEWLWERFCISGSGGTLRILNDRRARTAGPRSSAGDARPSDAGACWRPGGGSRSRSACSRPEPCWRLRRWRRLRPIRLLLPGMSTSTTARRARTRSRRSTGTLTGR